MQESELYAFKGRCTGALSCCGPDSMLTAASRVSHFPEGSWNAGCSSVICTGHLLHAVIETTATAVSVLSGHFTHPSGLSSDLSALCRPSGQSFFIISLFESQVDFSSLDSKSKFVTFLPGILMEFLHLLFLYNFEYLTMICIIEINPTQ